MSHVVYQPGYLHNDAVIGDGAMIGAMHHIDRDVIIGEGSRIQGQVYICPGIHIGKHVFIGPGVTFTNDKYPPSGRLLKTIVGDHAIIGAGSIIGPGVTIGKGSVIGMGAVVTSDVHPNTFVYGNPAQVKGDLRGYLKKQDKYKRGER